MNGKFNLRMDRIRAFISKIRTFFWFSKKGRGGLLPSPLVIVACLIYSSYILHNKLNKALQKTDWPFVSFWNKVTLFYFLSFEFIRFTTRCNSLSLIIICCHSLSFIVSRFHSLRHIAPLVVIRRHSLSLVVPFVFHAFWLDVPLVCLLINDQWWQ